MNTYHPQTNDGRRSVEEPTNSTQLGSVRTSKGGYKAVDPAGWVQSIAKTDVKVPPAALNSVILVFCGWGVGGGSKIRLHSIIALWNAVRNGNNRNFSLLWLGIIVFENQRGTVLQS